MQKIYTAKVNRASRESPKKFLYESAPEPIVTWTTLQRAAESCRSLGAKTIYAAAPHGVFSDKASQVLTTPALEKIVITDTIPPFRLDPALARDKLVIVEAAGLFAEAIGRIHSDGSIVDLLEA